MARKNNRIKHPGKYSKMRTDRLLNELRKELLEQQKGSISYNNSEPAKKDQS